jgi:anti-sigma factor RsiW
MRCEQMGDLVQAYADQELSLTEELNFEQHIKNCKQCEQALGEIRRLRQSLRAEGIRFDMPDAVRQRVIEELGSTRAQRPIQQRWGGPALAIAAAVLICAMSASALWLSWFSQHSMADELVDAHIRSLQAHHLFDVASTDQHTVKPWFDSKIDFAPPVRDLAGQGFPLLGGRLDYFHGRAIAALVYGRGKHIINVFLWPQEGADEAIAQSVRQGYQVLQWRASGMRHVAVSDLNAADLEQFAKLLP